MKKNVAMLAMILFPGLLIAQDIIYKTNGEEISASVKEIGINSVSYISSEDPNAGFTTIPKDEIFLIKYSNGDKEKYTDLSSMKGNGTFRDVEFEFSVDPFEVFTYDYSPVNHQDDSGVIGAIYLTVKIKSEDYFDYESLLVTADKQVEEKGTEVYNSFHLDPGDVRKTVFIKEGMVDIQVSIENSIGSYRAETSLIIKAEGSKCRMIGNASVNIGNDTKRVKVHISPNIQAIRSSMLQNPRNIVNSREIDINAVAF